MGLDTKTRQGDIKSSPEDKCEESRQDQALV